MYDYKTALEQEWAVFRALAPKELVDLFLEPNPDYATREAIDGLLIDLGFFELSMEYCHRKRTKKANLTVLDGREFTSRDLLRLLMDNIQSEGLHSLLDQRVGYLY